MQCFQPINIQMFADSIFTDDLYQIFLFSYFVLERLFTFLCFFFIYSDNWFLVWFCLFLFVFWVQFSFPPIVLFVSLAFESWIQDLFFITPNDCVRILNSVWSVAFVSSASQLVSLGQFLSAKMFWFVLSCIFGWMSVFFYL